MGSSSSMRKERVKTDETQVVASSLEHEVTAPSQSEEACDERPSDIYLPGLTCDNLPNLIDFDHGLVEELIRLSVVDRKKFEPFTVRELGANADSDAHCQLMNDVINGSTEQKEQFLSALDRTQQSHVTNYIRHNGQRPADTDNWPLLNEQKFRIWPSSNLIDLIDVECGFLDEIISAGILSEEQRTTIAASSLPDRSKVEKLLHMMRHKSVADYKKFIDCLVKTKQFRVVSMLDPQTAVTCPPLSEDQRAKLNANQAALEELIDIRYSGLLEELWAVDCLTLRQKDYIRSTDRDSDRKIRLLDILSRGSQLDFDKFIQCLGETGQRHVAYRILADPAVAVSPVTAHGTDVDNNERYILEAFKDLLRRRSVVSGQQLRIQAARALGTDNELLFMKKTKSITLFIASRSLSGLTHLWGMYLNTELKYVIQQIFTELLGMKNYVFIDKLTWGRSDYERRMQHLSEAPGLSRYLVLGKYSIMDRFPHELIELLLIKVAGQLFVNLRTIKEDAVRPTCTVTLVILGSVCRYWWQTLTYRRSNKRRLRRYARHLWHLFTVSTYNAISKHSNQLIDLIDIRCGLLEELISTGSLNEAERAAVSADTFPDQSKVEELLRILQSKSVADTKSFTDCLVKTKQFRVASMLDPKAAAYSPPLSEDQRAELEKMFDSIDTRYSGLLEKLQVTGVLTLRQKEYIESNDLNSARTRRLLDILRKGSQSDYDNFILCLGDKTLLFSKQTLMPRSGKKELPTEIQWNV